MEKIYVLEPTHDHLNNKITVDGTLRPFSGADSISIFLTSKEINLTGRIFSFDLKISEKIVRDYLYTDMRWPIFSVKMTRVVDSFHLNYEKFEVILNRKIDTLKYFAFQILPIEGLIDFTKSDTTPNPDFPDFIFEIRRLEFTTAIKKSPQIFRVKEYPIKLFLRYPLANALMDENLKGIRITPVDEYDWFLKG